MFLKKSVRKINGKTYCHYKIVESYREDGKIKHRILFPLGALTDEEADRMRLAISAYSNPNIVVSKSEDIVVTKHTDYLGVAVLHHLWQDWGFHKFFSQDRWVEAMVLNRCIQPVSKINLKEWMVKTVLPAFLDVDPVSIDPFDVYRELDRLFSMDEELQSFLFRIISNRWPSSSDAFFYDITSTYVTGSRCVIATLGYSRDHRPDCEQIVIALMITPEGYPFYWRVMEGNTQDITTVSGLIQDVKARFKLNKCTMVFDRGMVSADNLKAIEDEQWVYVSAMDRDEINSSIFFASALPEPATPDDFEQILAMQEFVPVDDNAFLYCREFTLDNKRYILTFDVARFLHERRLHMAKLDEITQWVEQKNKSLSQAKKARSQNVLEREIISVLKRKHLKKMVTVHLEPCSHEISNKSGQPRLVQSFKLSFTLNQNALLKERRLHGITCFITNLPKASKSAQEIIQWYRRKNKVEEAFHEIKSHIELRPVYLTRDQRVKAHVTICVLAYFLYNDIERRLKESNTPMSPKDVFALLDQCKINHIAFNQAKQKSLSITEVSHKQREILQALECDTVVEAKQVKEVLKKAENRL